jgi:hypothetical protein
LQTKYSGLGDVFEVHYILWVIFKYPRLIPSCNAVKKTVIFLTSLDEVLAWHESLLLLLARESVWDELCVDPPLPEIFMAGLTTVSLLMCNSCDIILRASRRSRITISRTFAIVSAVREIEGPSLLGSSWRSSRHSLSRLNHSDTLLQLKAASP